MNRIPFLLLLLMVVGGCTKYVVRDTAVYQVELDQYDAWATQQAALLKVFVRAHCVCNEAREFTTPDCAKSADFILTIGARHEWHKAMSLFLAGITEDRPSETPPEIPPNSTLCIAGPEAPAAAPTPEPEPAAAPTPEPEPAPAATEGGE